MHSSSLDQRGTNHPSSTLAVITTAQQTKQLRNHRRRRNTDSLNSNESSNSSMSEEDDDYNETDGSDHHQRPIEPILTAANVGPTVGSSLNQPFQIRSSVHLEHRLGPMTINQPPNVNNNVASCAVCSIL